MKNITTTILTLAILISCVSALNITAGESQIIELSKPYSYYEITENTTEVDLNITNNGNQAIITSSKYMPSGSFRLTFFSEEGSVIDSGNSRGSRGGSGYFKGIYIINDKKFKEGYSKKLFIESGIKFGENKLMVVGISGKEVEFDLNGRTFKMLEGTERNECEENLFIKLNKVGRNYIFLNIQEEIMPCVVEIIEEPKEDCEGDCLDEPLQEPEESIKKGKIFLWVAILVILLIIAVKMDLIDKKLNKKS